NYMQPVATDVNLLKTIPILNNSDTIDKLKTELPAYVANTNIISNKTKGLEWFKKYENDLPNWTKAFKLVVLMQPTSSAAERVFSLLNSSFLSQQTSSLEDYV
uniref:HAT C-terminal dimerisation domain-containing protein n=1 Tax=Amphimedon queenslandica TaxID=400682 RepID=A0A1X7V2U4_AMPQE